MRLNERRTENNKSNRRRNEQQRKSKGQGGQADSTSGAAGRRNLPNGLVHQILLSQTSRNGSDTGSPVSV